jgi:glucose-6-phosphate 1-epimerase
MPGSPAAVKVEAAGTLGRNVDRDLQLRYGAPMTQQELNEQFGIDGAAVFEEGQGGLTRLALHTAGGTARVYLHGAHVAEFTPAGHEPVLWMSEHSEFAPGKPIRGGIPVCFPWFGAHPSDPSLPNHGIVRLREWRVDRVWTLDSGAIAARFAFESDGETNEVWPHDFVLQLTVSVSDRLGVRLEVYNSGAEAFTITEALHTYLQISAVKEVWIDGLDNTEYVDTVPESRPLHTQHGTVEFAQETDRVYLDTAAPCRLRDRGLDRSTQIDKHGSQSTVVWNPWVDKASRMPDFGDDEWQSMVCIETANALRNSVTVKPGSTHTMEAEISVYEGLR